MKKNKLLTMKVTESEKIKWKAKADDYQITLSELIRNALNRVRPNTKTANKDLLRAINSIGNNLNQISRKVNQNESIDVPMALISIERQLERILNAHQIY